MGILVTVSGEDIFVTFTLTLTMPYLDFSFNTLRKEKKRFGHEKVLKNWAAKVSIKALQSTYSQHFFPLIVHEQYS